MTSVSGTITQRRFLPGAITLPGERGLRRAALAVVMLLAGALRFANLSAVGYANHYYTAAVVAMLQSWHNFFFVAAEPGAAVSVDKPPVGFWLQTISAKMLGVSGFSLILPEIVAGLLSVLVVYQLVRRRFGAVAGLVAGLALAITPVVVATDRNNTIDSTLIFTLLLAAWAFIKATETSRLRYLLLGVVLVGVGFNIKMLEAYLPLPAFYALYFVGAAERLGPKVAKLTLATALLLVVSLSWAVVVDATPADQRPYVGSSSDNSEISLIVGLDCLLTGLLMVWYSKAGKLQMRERLLDLVPWRGDEAVAPRKQREVAAALRAPILEAEISHLQITTSGSRYNRPLLSALAAVRMSEGAAAA